MFFALFIFSRCFFEKAVDNWEWRHQNIVKSSIEMVKKFMKLICKVFAENKFKSWLKICLLLVQEEIYLFKKNQQLFRDHSFIHVGIFFFFFFLFLGMKKFFPIRCVGY